jgi:aspartate aminotransferase-like enzyme
MAVGQLPYTPPTALLVGLEESLCMIEEESLEGVWQRHAAVASAVRRWVRELGLELLPDEPHASDVLTAVNLPAGVTDADLAERLRSGYSVEIGGGLGGLKGRIFRIGHMGSISVLDAFTVMGAVASALRDLGAAIPPTLTVPGGPVSS